MSSKNNVTTLDDAPATKGTASQPTAAVEVAAPVKQSGSGEFCGLRSIVTIANSPGEGGRDAVFISSQGVAFQLPRNKPWNVPVEVANVLRDANETSYVRDDVTGNIVVSESPRFSFIAQDIEPQAAAVAA